MKTLHAERVPALSRGKNLRIVFPALLLAALTASGCFLLSGQWVIDYHFPTPFTITEGALSRVAVDLNTISVYSDHKSDLKDVVDLALVGTVVNNATAASLEVWMVPAGGSNFLTAAAVRGAATSRKIWGPMAIGAGATVKINWDASAALFSGRKALVDEIKGDGVFDLYVISSADPFNLTISNGVLLAVVSAGK